MGAWIETPDFWSAPTVITVAPFVGAWIETSKLIPIAAATGVAPFVGAWIETVYMAELQGYCDRRSLRGSVD